MSTPTDDKMRPSLSERELQVLQLCWEGLSNGEIATDLRIASDTVKTHKLRIMGKLGSPIARAVYCAHQLGILPCELAVPKSPTPPEIPRELIACATAVTRQDFINARVHAAKALDAIRIMKLGDRKAGHA